MKPKFKQLISFVVLSILSRTRFIRGGLLAALVLVLTPGFASASSFTIDTGTAPMSGLWWNQNESGWGVSLTQQGPLIFVAWYTYDRSGKPAWLVMSSCAIAGNACSGDIYSVTGGTPPTVAWNGSAKIVSKVGSGSLVFSDANTGTMNFTINGIAGAKNITRQVFATGTTAPSVDYSALWWNVNESGWGVALTQQYGIIFATMYVYDAAGNPIWYFASSCAVSGNGCSGTLYKTSGGSAPTAPWAGAVNVTAVGTISFSFSDANNGTMNFSINGQSGSRTIARQIFYTAPATTQNVVPLLIDAGPLDATGQPLGVFNLPYFTLKICKPGSTTQCQTIDHVEVDTGSSGVRILSSALSSSLGLSAVNDGSGNPLAECLQFADGYTWGSVKQADVYIGGEMASRMSIHIVGDSAFPKVPKSCSNGFSAENTVASFGANGLVGVSVFKQDCGPACASTSPPSGFYYTCPGGTCQPASVSLANQVNNPVASFPVDNNGTLIQLPTLGVNGAATAAGSLIFGIGTQPNNGLGSARVNTLDPSTGNFTTVYRAKSLTESFVDSGSNGLFFPDSTIPLCPDGSGFYCPAATMNLNAVNTGKNGASATVNFNVANFNSLNPAFTAFNDLAGSSGGLSGLSTSFDWGLPFFFGHSVFTAIEGMNAGGTPGPYVAY